MYWEVLGAWTREPQRQHRCVRLRLCSRAHDIAAEGHPTSATSLETVPLPRPAERRGLSSLPCFTDSENQGILAPGNYQVWFPNLQRSREGK